MLSYTKNFNQTLIVAGFAVLGWLILSLYRLNDLEVGVATRRTYASIMPPDKIKESRIVFISNGEIISCPTTRCAFPGWRDGRNMSYQIFIDDNNIIQSISIDNIEVLGAKDLIKRRKGWIYSVYFCLILLCGTIGAGMYTNRKMRS